MSEPPPRRTRRLLLRAPRPDDLEALFAIQGNGAAMEFTYCSPSREATAGFLASYSARFGEDGFAPWTAVLAAQDRIVGWGGLNKDPKDPRWGVEVAYFIDSSHCGHGLATELVEASLSHAFGELGLSEVGAFVRPVNRASVCVLAKTGFVRVRYVCELERDEFTISAQRWRSRG